MNAATAAILATTAARIDAFNVVVGRIAAYLGLVTVLLCFATVYLRYVFGVGFVWMQESYVWTHVLVIMLGSGYAMLQGGFVRIDPFYNRMGERNRAWVDLFGSVAFMGPFLWMMAAYGWPFFLASWRMNERSAYETGLSAIYLLKGTLLLFVLVVGLQGISVVCRCLLTLFAGQPRPSRPVPAEEP